MAVAAGMGVGVEVGAGALEAEEVAALVAGGAGETEAGAEVALVEEEGAEVSVEGAGGEHFQAGYAACAAGCACTLHSLGQGHQDWPIVHYYLGLLSCYAICQKFGMQLQALRTFPGCLDPRIDSFASCGRHDPCFHTLLLDLRSLNARSFAILRMSLLSQVPRLRVYYRRHEIDQLRGQASISAF